MEEIWLSNISFDYLLSFDDAFCKGCPFLRSHQGYLNSIVGDIECTRDSSQMRRQYISLLKTLEKVDQLAGFERKIPIYINYYRSK